MEGLFPVVPFLAHGVVQGGSRADRRVSAGGQEVCVSNLQTILGLLGSIQSHDELRTINLAVRDRWHAIGHTIAQTVVQDKGLRPGQPVSFMGRGVTVYGTVKSINPKSVSVTPQGGGPHWKVSPQLLAKLDKLPEVKPLDEKSLMMEILSCYNRLSPENLAADGERPRHEQQRIYREQNAKLETLFRQLNRRVSESEAYSWYRSQPKAV